MSVDPVISFHPSLSGATKVPWHDSLELARAAGFGAVDVVVPLRAPLDPTRVRAELAKLDLVAGPASLPIEFRTDEDTFRTGLRELPRLAAYAASLGTTTMFRSIPAASDTPPSRLRALLRKRISRISEILDSRGLEFAIEVLGLLHRRREGRFEFIWRLRDAADLVADCPANVGLLADSWHWHHANETPEDLIAVGALIKHIHIADSPALPADEIRDDELSARRRRRRPARIHDVAHQHRVRRIHQPRDHRLPVRHRPT